jgi:hypothetical protein
MELSPSLDAHGHSASQKFPRLLWNPKVHYRFHNSPPMVPILSWTRCIQSTPSHPILLRSILILSSYLHLGLPNILFLSDFLIFVCISLLSCACFMLRPYRLSRGLGLFLFDTVFRLALGPTQPHIQLVPWALSLGIKRPWREAGHSPPSSAEAKECVEL